DRHQVSEFAPASRLARVGRVEPRGVALEVPPENRFRLRLRRHLAALLNSSLRRQSSPCSTPRIGASVMLSTQLCAWTRAARRLARILAAAAGSAARRSRICATPKGSFVE